MDAAEGELTQKDLELIEKMPLRKKIGQLFLLGFHGQALGEGLDKTLAEISPGGLLVFGRNLRSAQQISSLISNAQVLSIKNTQLPLLVATDQEGGDVIRIKTAMPLPSALALGKANREDVTGNAGFATGKLLKTLGFNMNLAPVLDVADPNQKMFIGTRAYGGEPLLAAKMGIRFSEGLIRAGVMPTGKHFPGHGGVSEDSHQNVPERSISSEQLRNSDLVPFVEMQKQLGNQWAVMLAHIAFPMIDPSRTPATFSKPIVTNILRNELGFRGLVLTDDIDMAGAGRISDPRERVIRAIEAGADMIVIAWNKRLQLKLVDSLEQAVKGGRISISRIDTSLKRILLAKNRFAGGGEQGSLPQEIRAALNNPVFSQVAEATISAQFSANQTDPKELAFREYADGKPLIIFSANRRFGNTLKSALPERNVRVFPLDLRRPHDVDRVLRSNPGAVGVFYVSGNQASRVASKISDDVALRTLLVTVETTGGLRNRANFRHTAAVYFRHPNLGKFIAQEFFANPTAIRTPASKVAGKIK
jgi:beta-N-acetylhexosaminidase